MEKIRLGRTGLMVGRTAFGAIPIQRVSIEQARTILRQAHAGGVNFFDTAPGYTDSEAKIGYALQDVRAEIVLATKSNATDRSGLLKQLRTSLLNLRTDYVDILQLHNPQPLADPNDDQSAYAGLLLARKKGMVRFVGMTNHRLDVAMAAARSGLYDTIQFPISAISSAEDLQLVEVCKAKDVGLIAMKPLCGGLLTNARSAFAFLRQFDNVVPIWGIQRPEELQQLLTLESDPPPLDARMMLEIGRLKVELGGNFCRGCGYCLPCPVDIPIPTAARMSYLLRRALTAMFLTDEWRAKMSRIEDCTDCGQCRQRCPYDLDTPSLLKQMYKDYQAYSF